MADRTILSQRTEGGAARIARSRSMWERVLPAGKSPGDLQAAADNSPIVQRLAALQRLADASIASPVQRARWRWGGLEKKWIPIDENEPKGKHRLPEGEHDGQIFDDETGELSAVDRESADDEHTKHLEDLLEIFKIDSPELELESLIQQFSDLFDSYAARMNLSMGDCAVLTIGQSPEFFREFVKVAYPAIPIIHIPVSGVSERYQQEHELGVIFGSTPQDRMYGNEYLNIFKQEILSKNKERICIIDFSNHGYTLNFFRDWITHIGNNKLKPEIFKMNEQAAKDETNIFLKLLHTKGTGQSLSIVNKLRFADKIDFGTADAETKSVETAEAVARAVALANAVRSSLGLK